MGLDEGGRHVRGVGEGGVGMAGALVEDGLGCGLDGGALLVGGFGPREVVIRGVVAALAREIGDKLLGGDQRKAVGGS